MFSHAAEQGIGFSRYRISMPKPFIDRTAAAIDCA